MDFFNFLSKDLLTAVIGIALMLQLLAAVYSLKEILHRIDLSIFLSRLGKFGFNKGTEGLNKRLDIIELKKALNSLSESDREKLAGEVKKTVNRLIDEIEKARLTVSDLEQVKKEFNQLSDKSSH
jgi:predicted DNA-binding protein